MRVATKTQSLAPLLGQAGLAIPRNGVANLVFFRAQGDCLAPEVRDGDVLFATWRPAPVSQARLDAGELAVFLIQDVATGTARIQLKRWHGLVPGSNGSGGASAWLGSEGVVRPFPASQVHLLANHVRLAQRGGQYKASLLAGAVHAGDGDGEGFVTEGFVPEDETTFRIVKTSVTEILADVEAHVTGYSEARWGLAGAEPHEWLAAWGPRAVYALFRPPYDGEPFVARLTDGRLITEMCVLQAVPGVEGRYRNCLCGTEFDLDGRQLIVYGALSRQDRWDVLPYEVPESVRELDDLFARVEDYLAQMGAEEVQSVDGTMD